jgi:hypothetical protein
MSNFDLDALVELLGQFPAGTSLQDVISSIREPVSLGIGQAKQRCALVRWFDQSLYDFLCNDLADKPNFHDFVGSSGIERLAPGRWLVEESERSRLLDAWQSEQSSWRRWNQKIGRYFEVQSGAEAELGAVYHLAAAPSPDDVIAYFQKRFDEANDKFDMAQCNALLEMLRLQESWRGPAVSELWHSSRQYYSARMLFIDDYYKTGSYFQRTQLFDKFESVLNRTGNTPWIFHIHATGGTGKTMFLRWLIARHLVPNKVLCARVDLDFRLKELVNFPLRLFRQVIEQLSQQPRGAALSSLLEN